MRAYRRGLTGSQRSPVAGAVTGAALDNSAHYCIRCLFFKKPERDESILGDAGMRGYNLPFLVKLLEVHDTVAL